jgi:hypothetical protein
MSVGAEKGRREVGGKRRWRGRGEVSRTGVKSGGAREQDFDGGESVDKL